MSSAWRYCGPPGRSPLSLLSDSIRSGSIPAWEELSLGTVQLTWRCTTAIRLVLDSWGIGPGSEVLMPSYHCGAEVDAVLSTGASVALYRVDRELRIDEHDVNSRITGRTRVLYVVHYFGWPQELERLAAMCRRDGIKLLEDCALSLFSKPAHGPRLGAVGDASVYSFPKTLPVPDGGAAVWRHGDVPPMADRRPSTRSVLRRSLPLVKRCGLRQLGRIGLASATQQLERWRRPVNQTDDGQSAMPESYYFEESLRGASMSRCTRGSLRGTNGSETRRIRRRNFERLLGLLAERGIAGPLRSLPDGVCPLAMPIFADCRDEAVRELQLRGIEAIPWWAGSHRSIGLREFPESQFLKDHIIALPVHQQLTDGDIDYVAASTAEVLSNPNTPCAASASLVAG